MNSDVEEIKLRLNIVDVLGGYLRLEKAGANWRALCPFHNEKSPSFMVSEDKQIWHCFGCQKGGDIFGFVMEMEGLEFREALKLLAEKAGVSLKTFNPKQEEKKNRTLEILELATKFYEVQLWKGAGKEKIIHYLKERGLKDEAIKEFRLGYAPAGWRNLLTFLNGRGYKDEEILKTGLIVKKDTTNQKLTTNNQHYDRFRDRIMFPIADSNGKIVGFSARVAPGGDESQAKYVNTPETEVYHKSKILYGIDKAKGSIKKENYALLVEGNMDVIAASQAGIRNVVAVSGTALTEDQIRIIKRYAPNIRMFFDMDSAGQLATKKSVKLCWAEAVGVRIVELEEGKDAADIAKNNPETLKEIVEKSAEAMEYFFKRTFAAHDKNEVEDQKKIVAELLDMIAQLENMVEKNHWIKELAERVGIKEVLLTDMLKKATIKEKIGMKSAPPESAPAFYSQKKSETLLRDLAGLMLVSEEAWRMVATAEKNNEFLLKDNLLGLMIAQADELQFSFDNLIKSVTDQSLVQAAERIFFEKKYRVGLDNNLEEVILENPATAAEKSLKELKRELKKEMLEKISIDLKEAETRKDKEAALFLRQEFQRISQELAS